MVQVLQEHVVEDHMMKMHGEQEEVEHTLDVIQEVVKKEKVICAIIHVIMQETV